MSPEERQLLEDLFERLHDASNEYRDPAADRLINEKVRQQPYAPYFLAQAVIVQQQAIEESHARIQELEEYVQQLEGEQGGRGRPSGGFLGGAKPPIVGRGAPERRYRDVAEEAPQRDGGPWGGARTPMNPPTGAPPMPSPPMPAPPQAQQRSSGGGFLKGALATAAGVAGGAILFDQLKNMLGGGSSQSDTADASGSGDQYGPDSSDFSSQQASWEGGSDDDSTEI